MLQDKKLGIPEICFIYEAVSSPGCVAPWFSSQTWFRKKKIVEKISTFSHAFLY